MLRLTGAIHHQSDCIDSYIQKQGNVQQCAFEAHIRRRYAREQPLIVKRQYGQGIQDYSLMSGDSREHAVPLHGEYKPTYLANGT